MKYFFHTSILLLLLTGCFSEKEYVITDGYLDINKSSVYYRKLGEGPPLVIVHGGPLLDQGYMLSHFMPLAEDYTLIFYDQRLSGKSSVNIDSATLNLKGFAEDIELLRQKLNLDKISVLGHSWGGFLAMNYAIAYPENLEKLILSNSMPASHEQWEAEETALMQRMSSEDNEKTMEIYRKGELNSKIIEELMLNSFKNQFYNRELLKLLELELPEDYQERSMKFGALAPDLANYNLYGQLQRVTTPTLIIYGDHEPAASMSAPLLHSTLPNSTLEIISECGHFPFIEKPEDYFELISGF